MQVTVDIDSGTPLFAQLVEQIKQAVQTDKITPGEPLPSIRQLASDLDLNNKTVAKAYRLLERDNVIQAKGYRGTYIHPDAKANSVIDLKQAVIADLSQTIFSLRKSGVTDSEIRIAFGDVMNMRTTQGD
ncbi:MAG: GntR family transcriptional regulator [Pseudohongiellaceae bacterium]